jgi:hypothetical protein
MFYGALILLLCAIPVCLLWLRRRLPTFKEVPLAINAEVASELASDLEDIEFVDGRVVNKVGVAMRLAREVKLRFGGTPSLTDANLLVAMRHIESVFEDNNIRKVDRLKLVYKVRALVFVRSRDEMVEDQWRNSRAALEQHDMAVGWWSYVAVKDTLGVIWSWDKRSRVPSKA